jgi:hypothetical protein
MVRLSGQGNAVLILDGRVGSAWIDDGTPGFVRSSALVGWLGDVVVTQRSWTPGAGDLLCCEGEGTVLVETGVVA